ncbi:hypothetical protein CA85_49780 [Allorhodopirellula solitaria]|uniref:Uncharacterized protein n=1 Tax=Allorhodopirellula solitaria TaxID=2527987 RepID=A0A5C5WZ22_9BACT|nr:hypothetical protein CA85_49780 [Allorhodopirellula solitaria]
MDRTEDAAEYEGPEWNQPSISERVDASVRWRSRIIQHVDTVANVARRWRNVTVCLNRVITPVGSKGERRLEQQVTVIIGRSVRIDDSTDGAFCVAKKVGREDSRDQCDQKRASRKERNQNANHAKPVSDHLRLEVGFIGERLGSPGIRTKSKELESR